MRSTRRFSVLAGIILGIAAWIPGPVSAAELFIYWSRSFNPAGTVNDSFTEGGGSTATGVVLQSGLDVAANTYHVTTISPYDPTYITYSDFASLAGGTVSYGHISGVVTTSAATTTFVGSASDNNAYARFVARFTDTLTIMPVVPALMGQSGIMTGSVLLDAGASVNAIGSASPNEETVGSVLGILEGGYSRVDFALSDTDESPPQGSVPSSVLVPIVFSFRFGVPFDFGLQFQAESMSGASSGDGVTETHANATLNFLSTLAWQGITSVVDSQGNPVEFDLTSDSQTDWTQPATNPVPVPPALWLFGTAFAGALGWARRRKSA